MCVYICKVCFIHIYPINQFVFDIYKYELFILPRKQS